MKAIKLFAVAAMFAVGATSCGDSECVTCTGDTLDSKEYCVDGEDDVDGATALAAAIIEYGLDGGKCE